MKTIRRFGSQWSFQRGVTLVELMIVIIISGVLTAIAVPSLAGLSADLEYRQAARIIVSIIREARSRAIRSNLEHRVEYEPEKNRYRLTQGNRASNSNTWDTIVYDWIELAPEVSFTSNFGGNSTHMNTNGTSNAGTITISGENNEGVIHVKVATSGRIRTEKAN